MKVLMVCTGPLEMNGIATVIMEYYRKLKSEVEFDFLVSENINELYKGEILSNGSVISIIDRKKHVMKYAFQLYSMLKEKKYDVIHVHGNSASMTLELWISKTMRVKSRIAHCHNSKCNHVFIHTLLKNKFRKCYTTAIACSYEAGNWIFGENNFTVLDNGIETEKYRFNKKIRMIKRKELGVEDNFVIGHIGLFNEQKNHERLFEIFSEFKMKCPKAKLICISGTKYIPDYIKKLILKNNILNDVIILLNRNDVSELFQAMDFFLFPSKWEGLGIVAVEAQASGLFCLASDNVPTKIDITDNVIHLSLNCSNNKWRDEIIKHSRDITDRERMNDYVKKSCFDIDKVTLNVLELYKSEINSV